jgi:hypothetical protein
MIIGGVGVSVSLKHNVLSMVRIRGSSHLCRNIQDVVKKINEKNERGNL